MAYPAIHYGNFGDEKVTSSTKLGGQPLGIKMVLPDGREFVHGRAGASALIAGNLYTAPDNADTDWSSGLVCATAVAGATTLVITNGATTAITADMFADGFVTTASSAGTGKGYTYKIISNNSCATSATTNVKLYPEDALKVATQGATTKVTLRKNQFNLVEISPGSSAMYGTAVGIACNSAAASSYAWFQTRGEAACFLGASALVVGEPCVPSTTVAGALVSHAGSIFARVKGGLVVGIALTAAETGGWATVDLKL